MLFNTFQFILVFAPITLFGFFLVSRLGNIYGALWLGLASLVFYMAWDPRYLPLLLGSIVFNFAASRGLAYLSSSLQRVWRRSLLTAAITANLGLLGYFKYANFFIDNINRALDAPLPVLAVVLPLGISFFTFTQIAYLVDTFRDEVKERNFIHYLLFVTYFPHLIAGPILHHAEMMPQFRNAQVYRFNADHFSSGVVIFAIGLFKKAILADGVAPFVGPLFDSAEHGGAPLLFEAWGGALAYTLQLYFDFSGYCDMAIGLSWMIGIALPLNFNSPHKATSIIEFWRLWHMTLSRFLREYLYVALGGNRRGPARRYANLFATMVIGGLWHGAGWTFVVWGALHGVYLVINHVWHGLKRRLGLSLPHPLGAITGWLLTFVAVVVGLVFFRSNTLAGAGHILVGMAGAHGCALPGGWLGCATFDPGGAADTLLFPASISVWLWCAVLGGIAVGLPNTQEIMRHSLSGITRPTSVGPAIISLNFRRSIVWALAAAALLAVGLVNLPQPTSFLYFNF